MRVLPAECPCRLLGTSFRPLQIPKKPIAQVEPEPAVESLMEEPADAMTQGLASNKVELAVDEWVERGDKMDGTDDEDAKKQEG